MLLEEHLHNFEQEQGLTQEPCQTVKQSYWERSLLGISNDWMEKVFKVTWLNSKTQQKLFLFLIFLLFGFSNQLYIIVQSYFFIEH